MANSDGVETEKWILKRPKNKYNFAVGIGLVRSVVVVAVAGVAVEKATMCTWLLWNYGRSVEIKPNLAVFIGGQLYFAMLYVCIYNIYYIR